MKIFSAGRLAIAMVLIGAAAPSLAAGTSLPVQWVHLASMFDKTLEDDRMVGGSVALVENGKILARHDYGFADRANGRPVDGDTPNG